MLNEERRPTADWLRAQVIAWAVLECEAAGLGGSGWVVDRVVIADSAVTVWLGCRGRHADGRAATLRDGVWRMEQWSPRSGLQAHEGATLREVLVAVGMVQP